MQLENKVALITGASSGIGRSSALLFAEKGARLIIGARRQNELNKLAQEISDKGGKAIAIAGDIQDEDYAKSLVRAAISEYGQLDIAFNNAGTLGQLGAISDLTVEDWNNTIRTNLTSAFLGAKYQIPELLKGLSSSLIFTSTFVGYGVGMPGMAAYAASKSGLIGLTQTLAAEYGSLGLRVNALLPGGTDTPMGQSFITSPEIQSYVEELHALKRQASPDEIAQSALYLASDASAFVTGSAHLVDGGVSIYKA